MPSRQAGHQPTNQGDPAQDNATGFPGADVRGQDSCNSAVDAARPNGLRASLERPLHHGRRPTPMGAGQCTRRRARA